MSNRITIEQSQRIRVLRVIAVISIVMAHTGVENASPFIKFLYSRLGCMGVPLFLCISGFLFRIKPGESFNHFLGRKFSSVILPWLTCASVVFLWLQFRRGSIWSLTDYLVFILGYGSLYYYVPVLLVIMAVFFVFRSDTACYFLILANIISLMFTASGIVERIGLASFNYLNILNWCGFFAMGILARRGRLSFGITNNKRWLVIAVLCLPLSIGIDYIMGSEPIYFSWFSLCFEVSCIIVALWISKIKCLRNRVFFYVADISYCIYLLHQPIIGLLEKRLPTNALLLGLIPVFVIALMAFVLNMLDLFLKATHQDRLSKIAFTLIGVRR